MIVKRFTWVAFAFVGSVTALWPTHIKLEVLLNTIIVLAAVDALVGLADDNEKGATLALRALCNLFAIAACQQTFARHTAYSNLIARFDDVTLTLVVLCRVCGCMYALNRAIAAQSHRHTIVRTIVYILFMLVVQLLSAVHVLELSKLLRSTDAKYTYTSLYDTTRAECILPASNSTDNGFIFSKSPFSLACPTQLWKHIRNNVLFASQVYVLYTVTTDIKIRDTRNFTVLRIVLAAVECTALSAAAALQFDVIAGCETLDVSVAVPIFVAITAYLVRLTPDEYFSSLNVHASSKQKRDFHRVLLKDVKLKL